jgi:two-component system chemotaxis response regulator CheY
VTQADAGDFQLIITDLNMPVMDGLSMIRKLRAKPKHQACRSCFLTTESDAEIKAQAKAAGATGWLTKPFNPDQLITVVKKVLAK